MVIDILNTLKIPELQNFETLVPKTENRSGRSPSPSLGLSGPALRSGAQIPRSGRWGGKFGIRD